MELADYLRAIRAHWLGALVITILAVAGAGAFTMTQDEVYAASATGFVSTGESENAAVGSLNDSLSKSRVTSYVDVATGRSTAEAVIDELELDTTPATLVGAISVEQPADTVLLRITARASSPARAQRLADAWVRALADQVQALEDPRGRQAVGTPRLLPIEAAELPTQPVSPKPRRNLALGALAGLVLGFGFAMLRNSSDRKLRTKEAVEAKFPVTVAGSIPASAGLSRERGRGAEVAVARPRPTHAQAVAAEAFRKLRTNLVYMNVDEPPRVVVVTSPLPGDGKSTVTANLAAALATTGEDVVLVDGDLRRPTIAATFGAVEGVGLSDVLAGRVALDDALQPTKVGNLTVLAAGATPPNPSELLGSRAMRQVLQKLAAGALVLIDAPPLLPVTDAAVLATHADGAFVVISAGRTTDEQLALALRHLDAVDAVTLGVVFNKASGREAQRYGGYYGDYVATATPMPAAEPAERLEPAARPRPARGGKRRASRGRFDAG